MQKTYVYVCALCYRYMVDWLYTYIVMCRISFVCAVNGNNYFTFPFATNIYDRNFLNFDFIFFFLCDFFLYFDFPSHTLPFAPFFHFHLEPVWLWFHSQSFSLERRIFSSYFYFFFLWILSLSQYMFWK